MPIIYFFKFNIDVIHPKLYIEKFQTQGLSQEHPQWLQKLYQPDLSLFTQEVSVPVRGSAVSSASTPALLPAHFLLAEIPSLPQLCA